MSRCICKNKFKLLSAHCLLWLSYVIVLILMTQNDEKEKYSLHRARALLLNLDDGILDENTSTICCFYHTSLFPLRYTPHTAPAIPISFSRDKVQNSKPAKATAFPFPPHLEVCKRGTASKDVCWGVDVMFD